MSIIQQFLLRFPDGTNSVYDVTRPEPETNDSSVVIDYAEDNCWSTLVRGTQAASLHDDGNGLTIKIAKRSIRLTYSDIELLNLLLDTHCTDDSSLGKPKVYKVVEVSK